VVKLYPFPATTPCIEASATCSGYKELDKLLATIQ
jgi:hypothetical protein